MGDFEEFDDPFEDDRTPEAPSWSKMMKDVVEGSIMLPDHASDDAKSAERRSQAMRIVRALTEEAIRIAKERGFPPESHGAWEIVGRGAELAREITFACTFSALPSNFDDRAKLSPNEVRRIFQITHPSRGDELIANAKKGEGTRIDRGSFEEAVGSYLRSEFRVAGVERALLVALIDMEIIEYLRYVHEPDVFTKKSKASTVSRTPLVHWLLGRFWSVVRLIVVTACIVSAASFGWISGDTSVLLFFGAVILFSLGTILTIFFYFAYRKQWAAQRKNLVDLPYEMIGLYRELHSDGPQSVRRVRERVQQLADIGTVWPGAVWALLDDMEARKVVAMHG